MKVLYISHTGMTEPLGESQVIEYLLDLSKNNVIFLISFEKQVDQHKYNKMKQRLLDANIQWKHFKYSNRYGMFSTLLQVANATVTSFQWVITKKISLIHARSLVPATIGMIMKKIFNIKLLFDIRGFTIDEKIVDGRLKHRSFLTYILRKLEIYIYINADHIVTLTHVSKPLIQQKYSVSSSKISIIPTCASSDLFKLMSSHEKSLFRHKNGYTQNDLIIIHNGSLNQWVDFEAELKLFEKFSEFKSNAKFIFLNKGQHEAIKLQLQMYNIDINNCKIIDVPFKDVYKYLNIADLCVFFIKPSFAKQASAPTKFAEIVSCHLLSVTNTNYGDMEYYLKKYPVGMLIELANVYKNPKQQSLKVIEFINRSNKDIGILKNYFDALSYHHLSKEIAIKRYNNIYTNLII